MKKILVGFFGLFVFCFAQYVSAENISHFNSSIVINEDATVNITETISYDFGELKRHGMFRDIPVKYNIDLGAKYTAKIDNISVAVDGGKNVPFSTNKSGNNLQIKIGDPNSLVTGKHNYTIKYTVHDAITYFDDHQEFYWNVTGSGWPVDMNTVTTIVNAPVIDKTDCFVGAYGSKDECDSIGTPSSRGDIMQVTFAHNSLYSFNGMTIVVSMPANTVYQPSTMERMFKFFVDNWILVIPFIVLIFMWRRWYRYGRDPKGTGVVVPYYEGPDGLSPAEVGMVIDEIVHDRDIAAAIIDIAVKGYMRIRKDGKKEYLFIKINEGKEKLSDGEQALYDGIFKGQKSEVKLSSLKNSFYIDLAKAREKVIKNMIDKGYYAKKPVTVREKYMSIAFVIFASSFFIGSFFGIIYGFAVAISAIPVLIFGWFMPRRTKEGVLMAEKILGLKLYLETAEKDRINFHNAPEKNPQQFEKLLPYAMALGVENQWASQFDGIYEARPNWYEGTSAFTASAFASEMHTLGKSTNSVLSSKSQTSYAASGGSGFSSGGGFSGGGFGGGGGGSW